jgi:hypothetical protein
MVMVVVVFSVMVVIRSVNRNGGVGCTVQRLRRERPRKDRCSSVFNPNEQKRPKK